MTVSPQIAQARLDYFNRTPSAGSEAAPESLGTTTAEQGLFGKDGLTFGDVLDAVNPLNHIPIVSDLFASTTGSAPSAASKLVGGALMGGPIGFVASLANVIFEQATGASPIQAVVAAFSGESTASETQVASAKQAQEAQEEANASTTTNGAVELASLNPASSAISAQLEANRVQDAVFSSKEKAVLDLYGDSGSSAHDSYRKAQLRPYLQDVTVSKLL
jgi:hypothetical protein